MPVIALLVATVLAVNILYYAAYAFNDHARARPLGAQTTDRDDFISALLSNMTVPELARQLHLVFADDVVGPDGANSLFLSYVSVNGSIDAGIGVIHDWYPTDIDQFNQLQELNLNVSSSQIPFMQTGEYLHGVGSFRQSMFPSPIGLAASFDPEMIYKVGRALGSEARSIGIHACFSPVLDLGKDARWGRTQEGLGEDFFLTSVMGVAYAQGLSKNSSWSEPDAVVPIAKHFAAHGSPSGGINAAPYTGFGWRQIMSEMLIPFRDVIQLGGAKGVMMAYHDVDGIPAPVNEELYEALISWSFDGFAIGDDGAISLLETGHRVAEGSADAIGQWLNAGGAIEYYDYDLPTWQADIDNIVADGTVSEGTLRSRVRGVLDTKWSLGLFEQPFIPYNTSIENLVAQHVPLTLTATERSLVLLVNQNHTLPIAPDRQNIERIALIGPMADTYNFGDYSGVWGAAPIDRAITLRAAMESYLSVNATRIQLTTSWGADTWAYQGQYPVPRDLLSTKNGTVNGFDATYFSDTAFQNAVFTRVEAPNQQWGLYAPLGLPTSSVNFSAVWEGRLRIPYAASGCLGVAISRDSTAALIVNGKQLVSISNSSTGNMLGDIVGFPANSSAAPPGCTSFKFTKNTVLDIKLKFQAWSTLENRNSINNQIQLIWNPVDRHGSSALDAAVNAARDADLIVFAGGAAWNSDGENSDRATMGLSLAQSQLLDALFALHIPVVVILEGGRPFSIPEYYSQAAAVIAAYFPGPQGGQAISNTLFGLVNPGGRLALSIPASVGTLPAYYNYKATAHDVDYRDTPTYPLFSFGFGLSYTTFERTKLSAFSSSAIDTFGVEDIITFRLSILNSGPFAGSDVPQVYLLARTSSVVQPLKQMIAFARVDLEPGEERVIHMPLNVSRFLQTYTRHRVWTLEPGEYTFALTSSEHNSDTSVNVTMRAITNIPS